MAKKRTSSDGIVAESIYQTEDSYSTEVVAGSPPPKRRRLRLSFNAPVVIAFALISLLALGLSYLPGNWNMRLFAVYRAPFTDWLTYPRFFLHVLGHANIQHYLSNLMLLLVLGPPLEAHYGHRTLIEIMAIVALVSGLIQFIFFPGTALLGASGIVFAFIVLASMIGMQRGTIPLTMIFAVLLWVGTEVWNMFAVTNDVSELTHIVGGTVGAILGFVLAKRSQTPEDGDVDTDLPYDASPLL